jgi:hypothetical protein
VKESVYNSYHFSPGLTFFDTLLMLAPSPTFAMGGSVCERQTQQLNTESCKLQQKSFILLGHGRSVFV